MTDAPFAVSRRAAQASDRGCLGRASRLKGGGYLVSTASVFLLAAPGFKTALEQPAMFACLIAGVVTSIGGMALRWRSHRLEQKEQAD